jgi:hypothetical protein
VLLVVVTPGGTEDVVLVLLVVVTPGGTVVVVTLLVDVVVNPTPTTISLDGPLVPLLLVARTRTKYVPDATPVAVNVTAVEPVLKFAKSASPDAAPASTT